MKMWGYSREDASLILRGTGPEAYLSDDDDNDDDDISMLSARLYTRCLFLAIQYNDDFPNTQVT
jgi:hypothetical protein